MKHFEASGLWYPSDDTDNAVGGTLKFDDNGLHLILLGSFRQGWTPVVERYANIHGVVGDSPYGAFVTLLDCFRTGHKFNMVGATSERIRCQKAVVGNRHLPEESSRFTSLELDFSYLSEWVGRGGLDVDRGSYRGKSYTAKYQKPENVGFEFGDKTLTMGFIFNASESSHKITLSEEARLIVEPVGDLNPETIGEDHISTLQNLLSFATDTANGVEEIAYQADTDEKGFTPNLKLIYDPIFRLKEKKDSLNPMDMLFTYADSRAIEGNIFQKWLEFSRDYRSFCDVYFGHTYIKPKFLEDRFANVVAAFTLLSPAHKEVPEKIKLFVDAVKLELDALFSEEERALLVHVVPTENGVEMPFRLLRSLEDNSDMMSQVIEDFPSFAQAVSDTLSFNMRRVKGVRPPLEGGDLIHAVEKISMLIKIVVLKELGFGRDDVRSLVERNKLLNHLKMV